MLACVLNPQEFSACLCTWGLADCMSRSAVLLALKPYHNISLTISQYPPGAVTWGVVAAPCCLCPEASQQGKLPFHLECPAVKSKSACTYADREADSFLQRLQHVYRRPLSSQLGLVRATSQGCHGVGAGQMLDHRPHQQHGPPLEILSEAFAECSDLMRSVVPSRPTARQPPFGGGCLTGSASLGKLLQLLHACSPHSHK